MRSLSIGLLLTAWLMPGLSGAQDVDDFLASGQRTIQLAQASQQRVDKVVEETRSLIDQYRAVMKEVDGLEVYNTLLARQVRNQEQEMVDINDAIDRVTVIERQIMPLMLRMIDGLDQFVELDVPFLIEERRNRVDFLRNLMERSDVTVAEKFRRVTEAFQIENDFGRTIESYKGTLEIEGGTREVDFLRIGRVALMYQTADGAFTGAWNKQSGNFESLGDTYRAQVRQGLKMANQEIAPDLLLLPVSAPEAIR